MKAAVLVLSALVVILTDISVVERLATTSTIVSLAVTTAGLERIVLRWEDVHV